MHWHGLRVPIADGRRARASQPDVQPGESFTYDFIVPDAGLFWYHPHVMSAAQVGFGLYGALLVDDPRARRRSTDELVLVLSDIGISPSMVTLESPEQRRDRPAWRSGAKATRADQRPQHPTLRPAPARRSAGAS